MLQESYVLGVRQAIVGRIELAQLLVRLALVVRTLLEEPLAQRALQEPLGLEVDQVLEERRKFVAFLVPVLTFAELTVRSELVIQSIVAELLVPDTQLEPLVLEEPWAPSELEVRPAPQGHTRELVASDR